MRITERRLRSIIRNVIRESMDDDESYPVDDSIYAPFDDELEGDQGLDLHDDMEIIDADDIPQLDHEMSDRGETRRFMQRNRRAAAERDRGSYATRGAVHSSQIDMLDDMGEIGRYDEDDYDY